MPRKTTTKQEPEAIPQAVTTDPQTPPPPPPNGELPGTDPGDLGDFARFAVDGPTLERVEGDDVVCKVGPPGKMNFFRCPTDPALYRTFSFLEYEHDGTKRTQYLVSPQLCHFPELEDRVAVKRTSPYVTHHGYPGIWLSSIVHEENPWVLSALLVIEKAKAAWVAAIPARGRYKILVCERDHGEPKWPRSTLSGWLELAFPPEKRITVRDHPIMAKLREG